jgi:hypothetical protein
MYLYFMINVFSYAGSSCSEVMLELFVLHVNMSVRTLVEICAELNPYR